MTRTSTPVIIPRIRVSELVFEIPPLLRFELRSYACEAIALTTTTMLQKIDKITLVVISCVFLR